MVTGIAAENSSGEASMPYGGWQGGHVNGVEADTLFLAQDALRGSSQEWREFYVQALVEHVVNGKSPLGTVDDARARWLLSRIREGDMLPGREELELVIGVLERADSASDLLREAALATLLQTVTTGKGPTRYRGGLGAGSISPEEVELLVRVLRTNPGGFGSISTAQARYLFQFRGAVDNGANPKQWALSFIEMIGNYLKSFDGGEPLKPEREKEFASFMQQEGAAIGGFLGRLDQGDFREALAADETLHPLDRGVLEFLYDDHQRALRAQSEVKPKLRAA